MDPTKMSAAQKTASFVIGAILLSSMADSSEASMRSALTIAEQYVSIAEERYGSLEAMLDE